MRLLFFSPEWGDNCSYCIHAPVVKLADNEDRYQTQQLNYSMNMQGVYRSNKIILTLFYKYSESTRDQHQCYSFLQTDV